MSPTSSSAGPPTDPPPAAVDLWHVAVPLLVPFEASHGTESQREVVVVRVVGRDGVDGWGECDALTHPTYTHEYARGAFAVLRDELAPGLLAGGGLPRHARLHPMARAALATALADGRARRGGRSLAASLARPLDPHRAGTAVAPPSTPAPPSTLARTAVLGRTGTADELLAAVDRAVAGGAALVKLKLAGPDDLERFRTLRRARPAVALAADANGSLDGCDAAAVLAAGLDELGLTYLEQPYGADALLDTAALRRAATTPIALDESITSLEAARLAHHVGALDVLNLKPARLGGPAEAVALARWAADHAVASFCGGMVELGIGRAAAVAVAAAMAAVAPGPIALPCDLGPSAAYVDPSLELCTPVSCDPAGRLVVPTGAGIGVAVDVGRIEAACRQHRRLTAP
ncbi:MAG: enolase C-terminal domain-like protein [Acidimicrobiia bacterium]